MKKAVWISFDLGVSGDYEGMYSWLASHEAEECGDNLAFINFSSKADLFDELKREIKKAVEVNKKTRVYVIYRSDDLKVKGTFLFGARRQPPWTGYGAVGEKEHVDEA
jgi:hypothetical protein